MDRRTSRDVINPFTNHTVGIRRIPLLRLSTGIWYIFDGAQPHWGDLRGKSSSFPANSKAPPVNLPGGISPWRALRSRTAPNWFGQAIAPTPICHWRGCVLSFRMFRWGGQVSKQIKRRAWIRNSPTSRPVVNMRYPL